MTRSHSEQVAGPAVSAAPEGAAADSPVTPDMDRATRLALLVQQIAAVESAPPTDSTARRESSDARPARSGRAARGHRSSKPADAEATGDDPSYGSTSPAARRAGSAATPAEGDARTPAELQASAREICLRLLSVAPRPRAGLAQALRRRDIPDDIAAAVLDRFVEVGLIDDQAYAAAYVRTKHRDRGLTRRALGGELRRLGVDASSVGEAVAQLDEDDERLRAEQLVAKRVDAALAAGPQAARRRLVAFLARRGYPGDLSVSVVERALAEHAADR
jgi:regulatory protein